MIDIFLNLAAVRLRPEKLNPLSHDLGDVAALALFVIGARAQVLLHRPDAPS